MPLLSEYSFLFQSQAVAKDTFVVVRFQGEEGLSQLYSFEILLVSDKADLDLESILQSPATLTIKSKNGDLPYHGILASFEQLHQADTWVFYRAVLRPKLWWLTLTHHNQVFLNQKLDQFLGNVLQDGGLSQGLDFEFKLKGQYPVWDYLCQYSESHFEFVSRWLERDGVYYWFEQNDQGEKMIAGDTLIAHTPVPGHETFHYAPPTGLDAAHADEVVKSFSLRRTPMPGSLLLKDYNYEKPSLDLTGRAQVASKGRGEIYIYGEHFLDVGEGNRLASVRAEEWKCREQVFHGLSTVPAVRPGYTFTLDRHYRSDFNQRYLTTRVTHEGSQERYLLSGLGVKGLAENDNLFYRNTFECIPATVQFRPARLTEKPRIHGSLPAKVDAAGSGQYAELDDKGRYKIILPFDLSGRSGGKASAWVRMMQPYAGQGMGFHAPLHKGTEVLLSFMDGDPDRPVIAGAVPNAETPSQVNDGNQSMVRLQSASGNVFHMEDQTDTQRILLYSPSSGTFLRMGNRNDPPTNKMDVTDPQGDCMHNNDHGMVVHTEDTLTVESGNSCTLVHGDEFIYVKGDERYIINGTTEEFVGGAETTMVGGNSFDGVAGAKEEVFIGIKVDLDLDASFELEGAVKGEAGFGWKWTFHDLKEKFQDEEAKFTALKNDFKADFNDMVGQFNQLAGETFALAAATQQVSAQLETTAAEVTNLAGAVQELNGEEDWVVGALVENAAEHTTNVAAETRNLAAALQMCADKTQVLGLEEKV
ncbi:MAG TPA: type VI secretion system tip protein VgrG [Desulfovibrio sp.]|nr:type VI secretion system tip protein VgrG [Desulfovibrio sp.]